MFPSVSVVILNYNGRGILGEQLLSRFISSVLCSNYPTFEVLFFDNGSTDGSVEFVRKKFRDNSRLKIIVNPKNDGYALGNNLAVGHAHGKYFALLNNDAEVDKNWILELVKMLESDASIGIAQSKIFFFDQTHIQSAGNLLDMSLSAYIIGHNEEDKGQYDRVCEITFASGAALMIRRSLIDEIGLFDSSYFFYHDDADLSWRARLAGFKIVSVPSSIVYHKGQATSSATFKKGQERLFAFCCRFGLLVKNLELKNFPKFLTLMSLIFGMEWSGLINQGDAATPRRFLVWAIRNFRHNWEQRMLVQTRIRKVSDDTVLKSFLNSSLVVLRITLCLDKLVGGRAAKDFNKIANRITDNYYRKHLRN
ncbi:MAG: glycosyltransferase family 2 protein [Candidatus Bathyarchaeia archaeon]|jgi:GT2 family glycosyltransferase